MTFDEEEGDFVEGPLNFSVESVTPSGCSSALSFSSSL